MNLTTPITPPPNHKKAVNLWADEAIWGHRFHNDQTPWLVLLEFLSVFRSRHKDLETSSALNERRINDEHESISYSIPRMTALRELVFNNPYIRHIETANKANNELWNDWLQKINSDKDFSYLEKAVWEFLALGTSY